MIRLLVAAALALIVTLPAAAQSVEQRRQAVETTLAGAAACRDLGDAYWEIGDRSGRLAWGQRGRSIGAEQPILIASATKWLWGAYVVERRGGALGADDIAALTMSSGYHGVNPLHCKGTVARCGDRGLNPALVGRFNYDGAHAQRQAMALGLGELDGPALAAEMRRLLGADLAVTMRSPQPAGGGIMAPAAYGRFLHKLVMGRLRLSSMLGSHAVCTLPGACATAVKSPFDRNWHYSLHHWVEDSAGDDGSVSSAGAFGFYPWIAADRATWGLLARQQPGDHSGRASALCGIQMRKAWFTATAQTGGTAATQTGGRAHPIRDALRQRLLDRGR